MLTASGGSGVSAMWVLSSILIPMTAAFVLQVLDYSAPERMGRWIALSAAAACAASLGAAAVSWTGMETLRLGGWSPGLGIVLAADRMSAIFLVISAVGGAASARVALFPFSKEQRRFSGLFFILWASLNGIITTGDLFNLYVFFEILAVCAYVLAGAAMTREALEAGFKYLVLGTVGALFLLLGIGLLYMGTGTLNLAVLSRAVGAMPLGARSAAAACIVTGLGLKMGMFPFHFWLPDAHSSASTGVSMILSGVVVKASFYALLRTVFLLFPPVSAGFTVPDALLMLGVLSLITGHLSAQRQFDVKRMLAWSTVAHMGYLLIGAGCASPLGIAGALLHVLNHGTGKMGLFLEAGAYSSIAGSRDWRTFGGLGRLFPRETAVYALLAGSIAGIPPLAGFWSKWMIICAAAEKGAWIAALAVGAGTVLSCLYYVPFFYSLYGPSEEHGNVPEPGTPFPSGILLTVLGASAVLFALLYLFPGLRDQFLSAGSLVMDPEIYRQSVRVPVAP